MSRPSDYDEVLGIGDPTPGDPGQVREVARAWDRVADDAEYAETTLRGLLGDDAIATWIGKAGDKFRSKSSELPDQLAKVRDSYRQASDAMTWWAGRLTDHQGDADHQLDLGRTAKIDLDEARSRLGNADGEVTAALNDPAFNAMAPSPEQVQAAQDRVRAAESSQRTAQGLVDNAQARLDAARRLAEDAGEARRSDGREAARRIDQASDAGIQERSRWEKIKDGLADAWKILVEVCKIVVLVLGVVVLIIGGPLAWVVLAASIVLLVDAVMKYANGEGSLWEVGLAALGCIPGFKGLTSLGALRAAWRSGGALGALAHLGTAFKDAGIAIVATANTLRRGFGPGVRAAVQVIGREGLGGLAQLRTLREIGRGFTTVDNQVSGLAARARSWQGSGAFPGIDDYTNVVLPRGTVVEAGFPGLGSYSAPAGNAAHHGGSAPAVWEGLQVGPNRFDYRPAVVEVHVNTPVDAATGTTLANPQYGAGGTQQYFFDIPEGLSRGDLTILDHSGNPLDLVGVDPGDINRAVSEGLGGQGHIPLSGADNPHPGVAYQDEVTHHPDRFNAPDLGQINIDVNVQQALDSIQLALQGTGYYGRPMAEAP